MPITQVLIGHSLTPTIPSAIRARSFQTLLPTHTIIQSPIAPLQVDSHVSLLKLVCRTLAVTLHPASHTSKLSHVNIGLKFTLSPPARNHRLRGPQCFVNDICINHGAQKLVHQSPGISNTHNPRPGLQSSMSFNTCATFPLPPLNHLSLESR